MLFLLYVYVKRVVITVVGNKKNDNKNKIDKYI